VASRARGDVEPSPWITRFDDYLRRAITVTVSFNDATRVITGATVVRDAGCLWTKLLIGLPAGGGRPDDTDFKVTVPVGTTNVGPAVFAARGFSTIEQLRTVQMTAGL
jgi:hypothetical protein